MTDPKNQPAFVHCAKGTVPPLWMIKRMAVDKWDADRAGVEAARSADQSRLTRPRLRQAQGLGLARTAVWWVSALREFPPLEGLAELDGWPPRRRVKPLRLPDDSAPIRITDSPRSRGASRPVRTHQSLFVHHNGDDQRVVTDARRDGPELDDRLRQ